MRNLKSKPKIYKPKQYPVEVTNVSLTFNQFKLLPMDDAIRDFFEIKLSAIQRA